MQILNGGKLRILIKMYIKRNERRKNCGDISAAAFIHLLQSHLGFTGLAKLLL